MAKKPAATEANKEATAVIDPPAPRQAGKTNIGDIIKVDIMNEVWIDRNQNVRHLDSYGDSEIRELASSIFATGGLLQPIGVCEIDAVPENGNRDLALAFGYRRCAALRMLAEETGDPKWTTDVRAQIVAPETAADFKVMMLIENYSRKNLSPMELAQGIKEALDDGEARYTQKQIAGMMGMSETAISQHLGLLEFPVEIRNMVSNKKLSFSHARDLMYAKVPATELIKTAETGTNMTYGRFREHLNSLYGKADASKDEEGADGKPEAGSSQKHAKTLSASTIKSDYIPFLKAKVEEDRTLPSANEVKYTQADLDQARLDALQTVLCEGATGLAKEIEPFLQKKAQEELAQAETKELDEKKDKWLQHLMKTIYDIMMAPPQIDPATGNISERPSLVTAVTSVVQEESKKTDEDRGFPIPEGFSDILMTQFPKYVQERAEKKRKDAEKKAQAKAAKEAEEAKKKAEQEANGGTSEGTTEGAAEGADAAEAPADAAEANTSAS